MRWFSAVALVVSLIALGVSTWTWQEADARADAALQRREKAIVDKYRPAIVNMCREFGVQGPPENVQTLDELLPAVEGLLSN